MSTVKVVKDYNGKLARLWIQKCQYCGVEHHELASNWSYTVDIESPYTCWKCSSHQRNGFKRVPLDKDERTERSFVTYKTVSRNNASDSPQWQKKRLGRKKDAASRKFTVQDTIKEELEIMEDSEC